MEEGSIMEEEESINGGGSINEEGVKMEEGSIMEEEESTRRRE